VANKYDKEIMIFREALISDIQQIQIVRNSVKENVLSNPALVTDEDCIDFITIRGKGWVCEIDGEVVGFSIADMKEKNIWALFVHPDHEAKGIGSRLHKEMLDWYFSRTNDNVWLGTAPNTRAEQFYRKQGWKEIGMHGKGEIKFEMSWEDWNNLK
jgi:GNAT superfamily N-acetyltransferase